MRCTYRVAKQPLSWLWKWRICLPSPAGAGLQEESDMPSTGERDFFPGLTTRTTKAACRMLGTEIPLSNNDRRNGDQGGITRDNSWCFPQTRG